MNRIMLGVAALAVAAVAVPSFAEEEPDLARTYMLDVTPGHGEDFERAMKKQMEWYSKHSETWAWHVWQWDAGDHLGSYVFRSPGHTWADLDSRTARAAEARANFERVVGPHLDGISGSIGRMMWDVSNMPEDFGKIPMVAVYDFRLNTGMSEAFEKVLAEIHEAVVRSNWAGYYMWGSTVVGGELPNYWLVLPCKGYAELAGPDVPFWTMLEETLGSRKAESIKETIRTCVREQHSGLARFRPDLSYIPKAELTAVPD